MNSDYLVGMVLENRYEIVEMIGSGGMATVYKAKCRVLNRYVAIKVLKDSLKYDSEVVKRFNAESRAAACLSHPNIVQVYDVSEQGGLDYIVMEYVDGITLKDYIAKKGALGWEEACNFAIQIGRALECAHKNHIIHRDIKPHNVLLARDGMLKVADFGIAQATTSETIVAGSSNLGSVHYISPEQGRGGFTNEKSDIYSLGVVLYEMLTGTLPFDGGNAVSIAIMKLEKDPIDCKIVNPDIPDNVAQITMKAISKEQYARYQSASDMIKDLEGALKNSSQGVYLKDEKFNTKRIERSDRYMPKERKNRRRKTKNSILAFIIAILAVFLIGFGTYSFMSGGRQEYQVPDLAGMTVEEAEAALSEANLKLDKTIEFETSEEVEEGKIISQKPGANQYVKKSRKIKITVSSGLEEGEITIPLVEGIPEDEAESRLLGYHLNVTKQEKEDETVPQGYVISQSPKSNTKVSKGYTVTLYISSGKAEEEQAIVPKLTGYTKAQAEELLKKSGLSLGSVSEEANSAQAGTVIAQNPSAKTGVLKGSSVSITVSKGQEQTAPLKRKTLTITIPDSSPDTVHIKVVANGKTIHDKDHAKSEGTVDIEVQASKDASVQAYIDGKLVVDKTITF